MFTSSVPFLEYPRGPPRGSFRTARSTVPYSRFASFLEARHQCSCRLGTASSTFCWCGVERLVARRTRGAPCAAALQTAQHAGATSCPRCGSCFHSPLASSTRNHGDLSAADASVHVDDVLGVLATAPSSGSRPWRSMCKSRRVQLRLRIAKRVRPIKVIPPSACPCSVKRLTARTAWVPALHEFWRLRGAFPFGRVQA